MKSKSGRGFNLNVTSCHVWTVWCFFQKPKYYFTFYYWWKKRSWFKSLNLCLEIQVSPPNDVRFCLAAPLFNHYRFQLCNMLAVISVRRPSADLVVLAASAANLQQDLVAGQQCAQLCHCWNAPSLALLCKTIFGTMWPPRRVHVGQRSSSSKKCLRGCLHLPTTHYCT